MMKIDDDRDNDRDDDHPGPACLISSSSLLSNGSVEDSARQRRYPPTLCWRSRLFLWFPPALGGRGEHGPCLLTRRPFASPFA
jgi:hypothetical protein